MMSAKHLTKTRDRWVDGVVGGIARYFDWHPDITRLVVAVLMTASVGLLLPAYVGMMLLMPAPRPADLEWTGRRLGRGRGPITGVCGGLAAFFDLDPTIVRLVALVSILAWGIGLVPYFILAAIMPRQPRIA